MSNEDREKHLRLVALIVESPPSVHVDESMLEGMDRRWTGHLLAMPEENKQKLRSLAEHTVAPPQGVHVDDETMLVNKANAERHDIDCRSTAKRHAADNASPIQNIRKKEKPTTEKVEHPKRIKLMSPELDLHSPNCKGGEHFGSECISESISASISESISASISESISASISRSD